MFPISILKALKKEKTGLNRAYTCIYTEKFEKQWETKFGNNSERGTAVTDAISLVTPTRYRLITIRTIGNSIVIIKNLSAATAICLCYWCYRFPY